MQRQRCGEGGMNIQIRTGGLLGGYLPAGSERNRAQLRVEEGSTPTRVMEMLNMPMGDSYLVSVNGSVLSTPEDREAVVLKDGDRLTIMPPIRGG